MEIKHLDAIQQYWDSEAKEYCKNHPEHLKSSMHPSWGLWHIPEKNLKILDGYISNNVNIVDMGCGRGHDAVGYAEYGANVLALDISKKQLSFAIHHPKVTYKHSAAEKIPAANETIDIAISDHGAFDHSPVDILLQEVKRVLKPKGILVICTYSPLAFACYDKKTGKVSEILKKDYPKNNLYFDGKITSNEYSYAKWINSFINAGFTIKRLEEIIVEKGKKSFFSDLIDDRWASRWPFDIIWVLQKGL